MGRFQNYWHEINHERMLASPIDVARRDSGGGTVYHDHGNLNMTIFSPANQSVTDKNFDLLFQSLKKNFSKVKLRGIPKLGIFNCSRMENLKKVGGSAFRRGSFINYHHFTFLVNSNLDHLRGYLKNDFQDLEAPEFRATMSAPHPVENYSTLAELPDLSAQKVLEKLEKDLCEKEKTPEYYKNFLKENKGEISALVETFKSPEWIINESPVISYLNKAKDKKLIIKSNEFSIKSHSSNEDKLGQELESGLLDLKKCSSILKSVSS